MTTETPEDPEVQRLLDALNPKLFSDEELEMAMDRAIKDVRTYEDPFQDMVVIRITAKLLQGVWFRKIALAPEHDDPKTRKALIEDLARQLRADLRRIQVGLPSGAIRG